MNRWVRLFFLPIMLIAGVFTSFGCALIVAPFAFGHWLRQQKNNASDIARMRERTRQMREATYGPESSDAPDGSKA